MDKQYAPIILFTYCRPDHTKQVVDALLKNKEASESDLFIYSDAPKNEKAASGVAATRAYIRNIIGFKSISICEREKNWGLANSLIDGITTVINKYGRAIIVEDDIVTSPYFLKYMNDALEKFKDEPRVCAIQGYMLDLKEKNALDDVFLVKWVGCWGWATWKENWDAINLDAEYLYNQIRILKKERDFDIDDSRRFTAMLKAQVDGEIDSWAIRWYASNFLLNRFCLHPSQSLVKQIGNDGNGGTHSHKEIHIYDTELRMDPIDIESFDIDICENLLARKAIHDRNIRNWSLIDHFRWLLHICYIDRLFVGKLKRQSLYR